MNGQAVLLILGCMIFAASVGGLTSSLLNRRKLSDIKRTVEHTDRNAKMAVLAVTRREAKVDAELKARQDVVDQRPSPQE